MFDPLTEGASASIHSATAHKARGSAWSAYARLVRYTLNYKGRLFVAILFAVLIAASFGSMLVSMGTVVKLTFYTAPAEITPGEEVKPDPADRMVADIRLYGEQLRNVTGWAPEGLDARFLNLVAGMREDKMRALTIMCGIVLFLSLLIGIARYIQEYFAGSIGAEICTELGAEMYANLMRQQLGFFEATSSGEIISRFTNDVLMVHRGLTGVFVKLLREPIKALMFLWVALSVDPLLTLAGTCILPPVAYVLVRIGKKMRRSVRRSLQRIASVASEVNEIITGIAIVKGYTMESYAVAKFQVEVQKLRKYLKQVVKLDALAGPATEFIMIVGVVGFVLFSGQRVINGQLDEGDLLQLFFALAMMLDPVRKLSSVNNLIQQSVASAERVFEIIDLKPNINEIPGAKKLPRLNESIRFQNVNFSYDGKNTVLNGVDFTVRKGEMVALVGFSGAGKSTIAKLIPRFYDVNSGAILIDGTDIREATFQSLREQIGIVTQDTILFAETIRKNICFGRDDFSDEQVKAAAQAAHADEFIERMPKNYGMVLSEGGSVLSGGQRQRLAIARAIIKDPAILILDEATSSLDSESERHIQAALDNFVQGRTAIVIAHRLSTIQRADRILVLDGGQVAEEGTHETLLAKGGLYARLYETQFASKTGTKQ